MTSVVIAVAALRGILRGYEPVGDNALVELRARDVLTAHHPWLGTWSSASLSTGADVNHPGPLLFDLFAVPVRVLGARLGLAGGAAALNIAAVWAAPLASRRFAGRIGALAVAVVAAVLAFTMGSELLYDVWMPNILVLAWFAVLVMTWGIVAGDGALVPWAVALGSLCAQVHGSYLVLVPVLLVVGVAALVIRERRAMWVRHRRSLLIGLGVGALLWAQPLWEQFFGEGEGNLSRLAGSSGSGASRHGLGLGVRLLAAVVAVPPAWFRPGFDTAIPYAPLGDGAPGDLDTSGLPSLGAALLALLAVAVVVAGVVWFASRAGVPAASAGGASVAVVAVVAVASIAVTPLDVFGLAAHKFRWLWPVGALAGAVVLYGVLALLDRRAPAEMRRAMAPMAVGAAVVVSVATIPTYTAGSGPITAESSWGLTRQLRDQLGPLEGAGVVYFDLTGQVFAEPYSWPLMAEMGRRGVPFVVTGSNVRQVGDARRFDGHADIRLYYRTGEEATTTRPGATRLADAEDGTPGSEIAVFVEPFVAADAPAAASGQGDG